MRVLLVPYPDTWRIEGGHKTQQSETAAALQRAGVDAHVGGLAEARDGHDVVHFFGDPRPLLEQGRPNGRLVVSPVHFPSFVELGAVHWRGGRLPMAAQRARHVAHGLRHPRARRARKHEFGSRLEAIASADLIVANSRAEAELIASDARADLPPVRVAHSGVSPEFFAGDPAEGRRILGVDEPFVLCVGRVEPIKNQLTLAHALQGFDRKLVLVGAVLPGNEPYLAACRAVLPELVHIPHVPHDRLPHVYSAADAHALPSWFETTGLATLEALASGTPAVAGASPCVLDYFDGAVEVADPGDIGGLRRAVERALERPRGEGRAHAMQFTWDRTAAELLAAYTDAY
jgi:glycosyltransferase involved in cell wall biosynthesis